MIRVQAQDNNKNGYPVCFKCYLDSFDFSHGIHKWCLDQLTSDILQVVLVKIENVQEVNIIAKSFKVNPYKKILSNGITFLLMVASRGIIHARRWFHK
jgi:hypothetical protein